jgi:death on curing protein
MASSFFETLNVEDVLRIHRELVNDFARTGDPIGPMGVRTQGLLESAVNRQHTGHRDILKYPDPLSSAATLAYGVCCDHPFHNGNKRTALVAMLVHLDRNHLCILNTKESELYQLMLGIADHTLGLRLDPRRPDKVPSRRDPDDEVTSIKDWLKRRVAPLHRGERQITYRQLRQVLSRFGVSLEASRSNAVEVVKLVTVPGGLLRRARSEPRRLGTIGYRNEGTEVSFKDIKNLRRMCALTEEDGVDSDAFYDGADVIDAFINRYRTLLRRLAKT